jgi:amino acid permease
MKTLYKICEKEYVEWCSKKEKFVQKYILSELVLQNTFLTFTFYCVICGILLFNLFMCYVALTTNDIKVILFCLLVTIPIQLIFYFIEKNNYTKWVPRYDRVFKTKKGAQRFIEGLCDELAEDEEI